MQVVGASTVVVGHDMRPSSPGMAGAFAQGASEAGADVIMIGLASTDQLYFASGHTFFTQSLQVRPKELQKTIEICSRLDSSKSAFERISKF